MAQAAPKIHRLAIPNPFFEGRNSVYVIEAAALTLIDTGVATDKAYEHLCRGLNELGHDVSAVEQVILTHKHIDHIGNAWRIEREAGATVRIHELEAKSVREVDPEGERFRDLMFERMSDWQVPQEELPRREADKMPVWKLESANAVPFKDGDQIDLGGGHSLDVIHTPGHSAGSVCLRCGDHLFSGDHVLPTISPNVGAGDLRQRGMLAAFLSSLDRISQFDGAQVYPGHGLPFDNLKERCAELKRHHDERLDKVRQILASGPKSVYAVARELFGELKGVHILLGCAEANAHMEWLDDQPST